MANNDKPFFLTPNPGFTTISAHDELLHPERNALVQDNSVTETQYFGFSVPEAQIHALCYLWHHPRLKLVSGGLMVFQGIKPVAQFSELHDYRNFMSDAPLNGDLHEYRLEHGYGVKIIEPLKRLHLSYDNPAQHNAVNLQFEGLLPPVMFADGNHFEQAMHVTGELLLRGQRYEVDCYNVRDRSWGKPRPERHMPLPPMSWMTAVFSPDFAVSCCMMDQASQNPELQGTPFAIPDDQTLSGAWLHRDGKLGRVVRAQKRVQRAPTTFLPMEVEFSVVDEFDRQVSVRGTLIAANGSCPVWPNAYQHHPLMRWECEGLVTYGDCQEAFWSDYIQHTQRR
ncbi:MAG TPA: hypothetical protein VFY35_07980 [Burkholderiaceae bacterium]|nr:hypothetical protein [Burkholderiaceae bacterium]